MKRFAWILVVLLLASLAWAAKRVTVDQLEQILNASQGKPDAEVAWHLSDLELTERLSSTRLARLKASIPDEKVQAALVVLADASEFRDPPAAEIPATAPPDLAAQRRMLALTVSYVGKTIPLLPNFLATRVTSRFEDTPLQCIRPVPPLLSSRCTPSAIPVSRSLIAMAMRPWKPSRPRIRSRRG